MGYLDDLKAEWGNEAKDGVKGTLTWAGAKVKNGFVAAGHAIGKTAGSAWDQLLDLLGELFSWIGEKTGWQWAKNTGAWFVKKSNSTPTDNTNQTSEINVQDHAKADNTPTIKLEKRYSH